ncbi:MAG: hypothetical protein Q4D19_03705 [Lautropia sp.]|nr:hypothetical protein [Lautropia sp.]
MLKKAIAQSTTLGLAALMLAAQPAWAKDGETSAPGKDDTTIELRGADNRVRRFTLDTDNVLQPAGATSPVAQVRKATPAEQQTLKGFGTSGGTLKDLKDSQGAELWPVLRDTTGKAIGLPGGLIITFRGSPTEADARAQLEAAGLTPGQQIAPGIWQVQSPAGLDSIELANRLSATGRFADVSPNFWSQKALK